MAKSSKSTYQDDLRASLAGLAGGSAKDRLARLEKRPAQQDAEAPAAVLEPEPVAPEAEARPEATPQGHTADPAGGHTGRNTGGPVTPDHTPDVSPEVTPAPQLEVAPKVTPDATPKARTNLTPDHTQCVTPEATPEVTPIVTPEFKPVRSDVDFGRSADDGSALPFTGRKALALALIIRKWMEVGQRQFYLNQRLLAEAVGANYDYMRRAVSDFQRLGYITRGGQRPQGVPVSCAQDLCRRFLQAYERATPTVTPEVTPYTTPQATPEVRPGHTPDVTPGEGHTSSKKIDRKIKNLSISCENLKMQFPELCRMGFGLEQLGQIEQALEEAAVPYSRERVFQGLRYAEWELVNGCMQDKAGESVADPCSWVYRALATTGYYRRPKGYLSPEELAAQDAEAEAEAARKARERQDAAWHEAWLARLDPEQERAILAAAPGVKDPSKMQADAKARTLRLHWIKIGKPKE